MVAENFEREQYEAMLENKPQKIYMKTILGAVWLTALDPFSSKPQPVALTGEPKKENPNAIIKVWTTKEDHFLKEMNKSHFQAGNLREVKMKEMAEVKVSKSPNEISDDEIEEILNKPFLALKNKLDKFTKEAPVYRFLRKAEEMEKSAKIVGAIEARLSEIQLGNTKQEKEAD
jgi:hypothetical protein